MTVAGKSSPVPESEWDDMILVGFIARTHGNKGQVILNSESDFPDLRFRVGASLYARKGDGPVRTLEITSVRFQQGRPIVGFAGFSTISESEELAGTELRVRESDQDPLPEGSYYHHQLVGCEVVTQSGDAIGRVTEVQGDGEATRLVVRGARAEVLIPLTQAFCEIDVGAKRITVNPPPGLLEVNGEWR